jgi:hypothetical protein
VFFATFLKEQVKFESIAYPELGTTGDKDYGRAGALRYPSLTLFEYIQEEDAFHTDGDFELDINVANLRIETNGLSDFRLTSVATMADYNLLRNHTFIYAGDVISQDVTFFSGVQTI